MIYAAMLSTVHRDLALHGPAASASAAFAYAACISTATRRTVAKPVTDNGIHCPSYTHVLCAAGGRGACQQPGHTAHLGYKKTTAVPEPQTHTAHSTLTKGHKLWSTAHSSRLCTAMHPSSHATEGASDACNLPTRTRMPCTQMQHTRHLPN